MMNRFLFAAILLANLLGTSVYAQDIIIPATPDNSNMVQTETQPSPSATIDLKQQGQRLYAYVVIQQAQNTTGKIRIQWTPPLHSSCDKSSYILAYHGKKFHTQAYRTLGHELINGKSVTCTGTWQAEVKTAQGKKLTTMTIHIEAVESYAKAKRRSLAAIA